MSKSQISCESEACNCHGSGCSHEHTERELKINLIRLVTAGFFVTLAVLTEYRIIPLTELEIPAALIALALTAYPILKEAALGLIKGAWNVCELAALALVAAVLIGEFTAAAEIAFILTIGEMVEDYLYARTQKDIHSLMLHVPTTANIIRNEEIIEIAVDDIKIGDRILIRPGERIPVDGEIQKGQSDVDESFRTGESLPIQKNPGDTVYSGSINLDGILVITAIKPANQSSYAKVVELVQKAGMRRPPSHPMIDTFAHYYTPLILVIAFGTAFFTHDIVRGITVLIVACPCALLLATPSAVLAAIGPAAKQGILIKSGSFLEMCKKITTIVFDKTGTLTSGEMNVTTIIPENGSTQEEVLTIAGSAERSSPHPIARAILKEAKRTGIVFSGVGTGRHIPGKGAADTWNGTPVLVGNRDFFKENSIPVLESAKQDNIQKNMYETEVLVAKNGEYIGKILISDTLHTDTKKALASLRHLGYSQYAIITGDNKKAAQAIADELEIPESMTYSGLLPSDKEKFVADLQEKGERVCFVGDGTNDGPALIRADIGVGMGSRANTLALESSGVILMEQGLSSLPTFLKLGKKTSQTIKENISLALLLNCMLIGLAAGGLITPVIGAIGHQFATIIVLVNSIRLSYTFSGY